MYKERMIGYYPQAIQSILEFQSIIDCEYPEIENVNNSVSNVTLDAYLTTMSEGRIAQWEERLGIRPLDGSTLSDRRDTIIARISGQGKLNTESINRIVSSFTGGTADSRIIDGVLYISVNVPNNHKDYKFENLEQELANKIPAHLGLELTREYFTWGEVNEECPTWDDVLFQHWTWKNVLFGVRREVGRLDITPIKDFVLV